VFRLNVGISKLTYLTLFGPQPSRPPAGGVVERGHDFTALDHLIPQKTVTARSVRRGDRLLLMRQCGPENGYHGRARGDGEERDSDPSPTKTQRQARKRRTRSQSAIARMHVAAAGSDVHAGGFGRHRPLRQISIAVLPSRSSCWHDVLHVLCDNAIHLAFDDNPKALESEAKRTGCIVPNCLLA
jgi:hypothetical protein